MPDTEPTLTETCTYTNPVYKGYFADPFVWEHQGVYYAIGTGAKEAKDKWTKSQTLCVPTAPLMKCASFPPALTTSLPGILPVTLLRPDPALGDNFWHRSRLLRRQVLPLLPGHEDKNHQARCHQRSPAGAVSGRRTAAARPQIAPLLIRTRSAMTMVSGICLRPRLPGQRGWRALALR